MHRTEKYIYNPQKLKNSQFMHRDCTEAAWGLQSLRTHTKLIEMIYGVCSLEGQSHKKMRIIYMTQMRKLDLKLLGWCNCIGYASRNHRRNGSRPTKKRHKRGTTTTRPGYKNCYIWEKTMLWKGVLCFKWMRVPRKHSKSTTVANNSIKTSSTTHGWSRNQPPPLRFDQSSDEAQQNKICKREEMEFCGFIFSCFWRAVLFWGVANAQTMA